MESGSGPKSRTPATRSRPFLPAGADLGSWSVLEPLLDELECRPLPDTAALERWVLDLSDLSAGVHEQRSARYVAMTCDTADPAKAQAWTEFNTELQPKLEPRWHSLSRRYVESDLRLGLPRERYQVYDRSLAAAVELFREDNVPLHVEERSLDQRYQEINGAMTVHHDGKERTLAQMAPYLQDPDSSVREDAWRKTARRRLQDREELDSLYTRMVGLRHRIARNAGCVDFVDYQFKALDRFDYTPADCTEFHRSIESLVLPQVRALQERRRQQLGLEVLRPWDLQVDPDQAPALHPFQDTEELCRKCSRCFHRIDPDLGAQFDQMVAAGWLDLGSRKGKAPGGYQATFDQSRHPFIFMNAVGVHGDVITLLHEGGHAFHSMACSEDPLVSYRHAPIEFSEVASMSMELLALEVLDEFYGGEELRRARREQLERVLTLFPQVALVDGFQHAVYRRPDQGDEDRRRLWVELSDRYGGAESWEGLEEERASLWHRVLHLYSVPLYYVEYGIAQIGALQLWCNARKDRRSAIAAYRRGLSLGGSRPLPELWAAAGLQFDFREGTLQPLIETLQEELEQLR